MIFTIHHQINLLLLTSANRAKCLTSIYNEKVKISIS